MPNATQPTEALYVLTTVSPEGERKAWAPLPLKAAESIAQSKRDRGHQASVAPAAKAKKPTLAQVKALKAEAQAAFEAWGHGTGTEEQRIAYKAAYEAYEAALHARRPALAERAKLVDRRLEADGETFR